MMSKKEKQRELSREKRQEHARNLKRKERKSLNISDDDFYKREMKGLTPSQKSKMIRKRKELLKKEKRKNKVRKEIESKKETSNANDKLLKEPLGNGRRAVSKTPQKKVKPNNTESPSNEGLDDEVDFQGRNKLVGKIKSLRRKNRNKKARKRVKRTLQASTAIFGLPAVVITLTILSLVLIVSVSLVGGAIASSALSHPKMILELYQTGTLGDPKVVNTLEDVVDDKGKTIAKGIGKENNGGKFSYFGEYNDGTGTKVSGGTVKPEGEDTKEESSSGTVNEATTNDVKGTIWNTLRTLGYSKEATAGIMGNIQQESTFQLNATNGTHTGLVQWDNQVRYPKAKAYCKEKGSDITKDAVCQIEYVDIELKASNFSVATTGSYEGLKKTKSVKDAVYDFEAVFERSGGNSMEKRLNYANAIYDLYK